MFQYHNIKQKPRRTVFRQFAVLAALLTLSLSALGASDKNVVLENSPVTYDMLDRFEERFAVMDSLIFRNPSKIHYTSSIDTAFLAFNDTARILAIDNTTEAQINAMKSKTGLEIRGQLYARPGKQVSYDPDDPLVAYNAKAQAELQWNIFQSSLYKRNGKIRELQLKGELEKLNFVNSDLSEQLLILKQQMRTLYYGQLLSVVTTHADNVRLLMETQLHLLEHGKISGDDLLKLINEQSELERQLISIKADSVIDFIEPTTTATYISVADTAGIFRSIKSQSVELHRLGLRREILSQQRQNLDYLQTMSIQPFVRYSYYNRENVHNTYNLDVGVSFIIPVSREVSKKKKALRAEEDMILYEQERFTNEIEKTVYLSFHDLEIYNENIRGEFQRMNNLKRFLDIRTHSYSNVDGEYSRIGRLQEYNAYLQSWERLLDYIYRRDCILLDLQSYLLTEPVTNYIEFKELN